MRVSCVAWVACISCFFFCLLLFCFSSSISSPSSVLDCCSWWAGADQNRLHPRQTVRRRHGERRPPPMSKPDSHLFGPCIVVLDRLGDGIIGLSLFNAVYTTHKHTTHTHTAPS